MKKQLYALTAMLLLPIAATAAFAPGSLVKSSNGEIFVVSEEVKLRWIPDEATFEALGYDWSAVVDISDQERTGYPFGENMLADASAKMAEAVPAMPTMPTAAEIEAKVREAFADAPIMISVAKCESGYRQFRQDGSLVRSPNGLYIGIFQIDERIHAAYAMSLGMDVTTVEGNIAYARHLYDRKGAQPWPACALQSAPIKKNLAMGDEGEEVKILQEILNQAGFTIADAGPGSAGNETEHFGSLTKDALQKFQCKKGIVCGGDERTTGYGMVGPKTRAAFTSYY